MPFPRPVDHDQSLAACLESIEGRPQHRSVVGTVDRHLARFGDAADAQFAESRVAVDPLERFERGRIIHHGRGRGHDRPLRQGHPGHAIGVLGHGVDPGNAGDADLDPAPGSLGSQGLDHGPGTRTRVEADHG